MLHSLDEIRTTRRHSAQARDCFAFGVVVSYSKDLSKFGKKMGCPFNHIIGRFAATRVQHLQLGAGMRFWGSRWSAAAIEKDRDRRFYSVAILR